MDTVLESRKLAAVMFTDMVGYTALMQTDEAKARAQRSKHQDVLESSAKIFQGTILQYFGDGALILFDAALDAVLCAMTVQRELQAEPLVPLRIGISLGDVVYDDKGIYGDGVNIASRIESLSTSGAILVSSNIYDQVRNQKNVAMVSLGNFTLKNVAQPVEVFAIANAGMVVPSRADLDGKVERPSEKSIAVIPFADRSEHKNNEYFCDGITEEILHALSKLDGIAVSARNSCFQYKGRNEDIRVVGKTLGVNVVLEGSVQKYGDSIKISTQLASTSDGYQLWSEVYERKVADIFEVQNDIAQAIAYQLKTLFDQREKNKRLVTPATRNPEAYNQYLKGIYLWNKWNPVDIKTAIDLFDSSRRSDPNFSSPYGALSRCYSFLGSCGHLDPNIAYAKAQEYALSAIERDPNDGESYLSLAIIKFMNQWDWDGAQASFQRAIDLGLDTSQLHQMYAFYLAATGNIAEATRRMERAHRLDPLSLSIATLLGDLQMFAGNFEAAIDIYDSVLQLDQNFRTAHESKGFTYLAMGLADKALESIREYQRLTGDPNRGQQALGMVYGFLGHEKLAEECIERLQQRQREQPDKLLFFDFALIYIGLGDYEKALEYLNKTYDHKIGIACLGIMYIFRCPIFKPFQQDPRFRAFEERIGLTV